MRSSQIGGHVKQTLKVSTKLLTSHIMLQRTTLSFIKNTGLDLATCVLARSIIQTGIKLGKTSAQLWYLNE